MSEIPANNQNEPIANQNESAAKNNPVPVSAKPATEKIGFAPVEGLDFIKDASHLDTKGEMEKVSIDNTVERRSRWEKYLKIISRVASDRGNRQETVKALLDLQAEARQKDDYEFAEMIDYVKSVIANFGDEATLKVVLMRGASEKMQNLIAHQQQNLEKLRFLKNGEDLHQAAWSCLELAKEVYYQIHNGTAYRTAEEQQRLEEAKARATNIKIS